MTREGHELDLRITRESGDRPDLVDFVRVSTMSKAPTAAVDQPRARTATHPLLQLSGAALIGLFVVYGVGFSHSMPVHNAAHDVRHSAVFPCH